jgi:D-lactate dehydrogenase (cytochrome)/glycolate oxidase
VRTLKFAHSRKIPVVTRAAGTGLAGGCNALDGCIVLSVLGLDQTLSIDAKTKTAKVGAGVLNGKLAAEAALQGLYYAPDPSSRDISTIGGNIATNAGGACCLKYGVTGDHVAGLKVVLADGSIVETGRALTTKDNAGLDLTRLLVGSEGTLGVIVEATVRLLKAPSPPSTLVAFFDTVADAAAAIVAMDGMPISLLEMMDRVTVAAVDELTQMGLDPEAKAMVLLQSDAADSGAVVASAEAVCHTHKARSVMTTSDVEEGRLLLVARRMALTALEKKGTTLLDDVAVPKHALPEMFACIEASAERHGLVIGTFGHAGDGNLHPTIVFDGANEASKKTAYQAFDEIVRDAMRLGGTITGEHGVGSLKRDYLSKMVGETETALMHRIKAAFDPNGILNPGRGF